MECIYLDILRPLNDSENGNQCIGMMIDEFSKLVEMVLLLDQSALFKAQKLVVYFIATFGCPLKSIQTRARTLMETCSKRCAIFWKFKRLGRLYTTRRRMDRLKV